MLEALQRWAGDELRSLNAQIEFLLRRALRTRAASSRPFPAGAAAAATASREDRETARFCATLPAALTPATMSPVPIPTFREVQDEITAMLRLQGYLAAILVDLAPLAHIEKSFGGAAFRALREQVDPLLSSMRENFRQDDFVTRDEREGDRFLLFLSGPRRGETPFRSATLRKLVARVEEYLNPRVGRLTLPYLRERPVLVGGYGVVLWSPLESPERQILRLVDDAAACAQMRVRIRERDQRERLLRY